MSTAMELLETDNYFILNKSEDSLWFSKIDGSMERKTCWDLASAGDPRCMGLIYGILGKIQIITDGPPMLGLITKVKSMGNLYSTETSAVYCIVKVVFLSLTTPQEQDLDLKCCHKHQTRYPPSTTSERRNLLPFSDLQQKVGLSKTFGTIRNVTSTIKSATVNAAATATGQNKNRKDIKDKERYEKRILDELLKMYNGSDSFYYCEGEDLTSSLQRQQKSSYDRTQPLWKRADDRFFWNKHMLSEFICDDTAIIPDSWLIPVIQGFTQIELNPLSISDISNLKNADSTKLEDYRSSMILISRRSRFRAGTRYKRRGVNEEGHVANYVETEQILKFGNHTVSFVQVRGSVPLFWSQPGFKYRPPPKIDKGFEECANAFKKHIDREISMYGPVACLSLVEQSGKEKVIADSYMDHIFYLDHPDISFISFDFHEYCRGMRYENVSVLVGDLRDILSRMLYCWVDKQGVICKQKGVFRVNCIDCLDRTNIVQTALAKWALESQFAKLGIIIPDESLPVNCRLLLQVMWANNGDTLSKQYAGTSALKGDFTRTGERKFTGLMKDGVNSANRYFLCHFQDMFRQAAIEVQTIGSLSHSSLVEIDYIDTCLSAAGGLVPIGPPHNFPTLPFDSELHVAQTAWSLSRYYLNRFKDAYRQASIDTLLGNPITEDLLALNAEMSEEDEASLAEHVKHVIDDCKTLLVPDAETIVGAWGLINADPVTGDLEQTDMDTILILTRDSYYVAEYDEGADRIERFERVSLIDLDKIENGFYTFQGMFKQSRTHLCLRLNYQADGKSGFFHMFRSMNMRFFNNMAVSIKTEEEVAESMKSIATTIEMAGQLIGCEIELYMGKLEKKKSRNQEILNPLTYLNPITTFTRRSPDSLKIVGTKALNNMTSGLAKLNPITSLRFRKEPVEEKVVFVADEKFQPVVTVSTCKSMARDQYMPSCGILCSSTHLNIRDDSLISDLVKCHSLPYLLTTSDVPGRSPTPEILIDKDFIDPFVRLTKRTCSSNELDPEDDDGSCIQKASSISNLDLDEGKKSPLSPLSPLALNKETMLAPFSVFARGVQSLAPNAGKLARGVQNLGVSFDPVKLKEERRLKFEEDSHFQVRKLKCKSTIIQF